MELLIGLFSPLIGFFLLLTTYCNRRWIGIVGSLTIFISFVSFLSYLPSYLNPDHPALDVHLFNWIPTLNADFSFHLDHLSLLMTLIITGVGFLIHVYSIGYMEHEEDLGRYFACMNFFVFNMLVLVLASNLLVLFIGWEGVGLASYLLIGYFYTRPAAAQAATKAFVVNRIGDAGFLLGILFTIVTFGTTHIDTINQVEPASGFLLTVITILFVVGAVGKSAQLPLYTWLPDAMEGPTPVSALIHAATMVTAGVYLIVRLHPLFLAAPYTLQVVGIIGASTSLFAAICALGQIDLKRVLAYSTVSQLGLMFLAAGAGAFYSAMFHLTTHAFVKATLFLSAGNVLHAMNGTTNMEKMGGLAKILTKTNWLFLIGVLALAGIPPLAAFFSKDLILEQEYLAGYKTLFYVALLASVLTGFYLTRAYILTFRGEPRIDEKLRKSAHEAPKVMLIPVGILAFLSLIGGFLGCSFCKLPLLEIFLEEVGMSPYERKAEETTFSFEGTLALFAGLVGILCALFIYRKYKERSWPLLLNSFYVDDIYDFLFVKPLKAIADGFANVIEPKFFENMIQKTGSVTKNISDDFRQIQSGEIRSYVALFVLGAALIAAYLVF